MAAVALVTRMAQLSLTKEEARLCLPNVKPESSRTEADFFQQVSNVPDELLCEIFSFLDGNFVFGKVGLVCKRWNHLSHLTDTQLTFNKCFDSIAKSTNKFQRVTHCRVVSNGQASKKILSEIFSHESSWPSLKSLDLRSNYLGDDITKCISKLSGLKELNLARNSISFEGARNLAHGNLLRLESLDLSNNSIGARGVECLANGNLSQLLSLNMYGNGLGVEGTRQLACGNFLQLKSLDLGCNYVGVEGVRHLVNGNLSQLTSLSLFGNYIGNEGCKYIANGNISQLKNLQLQNNNIGPEGSKHIHGGNLAQLESCKIMCIIEEIEIYHR